MLGRFVLVLILIAANVLTGVGVVYSKHSLRKDFIELQKLQNSFDELQVEWGRLQLEQSTWLAHSRVEKLAREELDMSLVHKERLVLLESR
ncbi:MAG: cell division protein FtsL [Gammaproteobacteria bacterium]|nr:cell division protein FtsL [Gammaproteobacteria bacterium]